MSNGILPLSDETLQILSLKHPEAQEAHHEAVLQGTKRQMHSIIYEDIDEDLVKKAAITAKGGCGPCGLDADNWCRILVSSRFGSSHLDLRTSVENFVKRLCNTNIHLSIPLNKISGVRPIGVGQVLRRTAGKVVMYIAKKRCKTYNRITPSMHR